MAISLKPEHQFQIFGYPGLAMLCFLLATAGGIALLTSILLHDQPRKGRRQR